MYSQITPLLPSAIKLFKADCLKAQVCSAVWHLSYDGVWGGGRAGGVDIDTSPKSHLSVLC